MAQSPRDSVDRDLLTRLSAKRRARCVRGRGLLFRARELGDVKDAQMKKE
jgi:hypothetical protein